MSEPNALNLALSFAKRGFGVFPVWGVTENGACLCPKGAACPERSRGKHPASPHGFLDATTDAETIKKFMANPGTSNYGLRLPPGMGGFDVEDEAHWHELEQQLGSPPPTLTTITGNGVHRLYDFGEDPVPPHLHGYIVRSHEKGYLVGPGSRHTNGKFYDLERPVLPVAVLPPEWKVDTETKPVSAGGTITVGGIQPEDVPTGRRHDFLRDRARTMRGAGMSDDDIWEQMLKLNARLPEPKTEEEVRRAIGDLSQFPVDPLPITLEVPTRAVYDAAQAQQAQQNALVTLDLLPYGTPPEPLVMGVFIAAEGWTCLYANGGTGKGLLALWMMRHVLFEQPDIRIAVLDYEGHKWEWGNRARALGWTQQEMERVIYIDPYDPVWKKGSTLTGIAPELRPIGDANNVGLYIVDSYVAAAGSGTDMGGVQGATEFFKAAATLGQPGLVLAHTSPNDGRWPAKPFGSSFIHNFARETWAGEQTDASSGMPVKGQFGVTSSSITVELRNKKRSVGGRTSASQVFTIDFTSLGAIRIDWQQNFDRPISDLVTDVLAGATGSMTAKAIIAAIREDTGRDIKEDSMRDALSRMSGLVVEDKRPKAYSLGAPEQE